ncbi:RNA polymerase sigma factor [Paraburkholderia strydomiana]|uniref:RNA polymerase sigma factor n=1 Tax=Paraburkholderia strydomiana TaxID=1245417 RepID=UPI001BEC89B1|nr:RNA polymerase sigma factor [Paraburkholderia strydomiana]MBT2793377.1 RNA polymerase sigma factor [Paraburkholderia strydomiana]
MKQTDLSLLLPDMLPRLWSFAFRLSRNRYDAEELVQRACIRGLERAHQLRAGTSALNWMFSIVHSTWLNDLKQRDQRSQLQAEWSDTLSETVADPGSASEAGALAQQIIAAVERLPETQRVVLLLVSVEGFSYQEAADALQIPVGTVMSRLSRARRTIGALFDDDCKTAR